MDLTSSPRATELHRRLLDFLQERVWPAEAAHAAEDAANRASCDPWQPSAVIEGLKAEARAQGLWNLFLPNSAHAPEGLSNLDYAPLCELMGRVYWSPEVFNCSAPDTGNMEVLARYAGDDLQARWLQPLLDGSIRSAFLMTEPAVASSDATNLECAIRRDGDDYVINGRKWYASGAGDPRCAVYIVMGITDASTDPHQRHSMIVVPADTPGIRVSRAMEVYGYDDAPHGHMDIDLVDVRVPAANMLLGEGRGFEIAQGRLGPGRIHHCMRAIGMGERALEAMCRRLASRHAFGRAISDQSIWRERIAESRCLLDQARLMVLKAARMMDTVGNKAARAEIAMIKVIAPQAAEKVIDWAVQAHGAAGVSQDTFLAKAWAHNRTLRLADGPDEVHRETIARVELRKYTAPGTPAEMGNPKRDLQSLAADADGRNPQLVNSVVRAFSILRCFETSRSNPDDRYLGNQDIARRTRLPKATVSRLSQTLAALGYLEYSPTLEKYALGPAVLGLGHAYMASHDVIGIAQPLMQELADYTQAAVMLAVPEGLRMLLLEVCQGDAMFNMRLEKGARVPHGTTALGRADLAARPRELFDQYLDDLERTSNPTAWKQIRAGIERARQDYETYGFVFSLGDWNPDVFAVGVPMVSADRTRRFAFNISGRLSVMTREKLVQDFGPRLVALRNRVYEATEGRF